MTKLTKRIPFVSSMLLIILFIVTPFLFVESFSTSFSSPRLSFTSPSLSSSSLSSSSLSSSSSSQKSRPKNGKKKHNNKSPLPSSSSSSSSSSKASNVINKRKNNARKVRTTSSTKTATTGVGDANANLPTSSHTGTRHARDWYTRRTTNTEGNNNSSGNNNNNGVKRSRFNRKKPPKWETEADSLFLLVKDDVHEDINNKNNNIDTNTQKTKGKKKEKKKKNEDIVVKDDISSIREILKGASISKHENNSTNDIHSNKNNNNNNDNKDTNSSQKEITTTPSIILDYSKLTVIQLKEHCRNKKLPVSGKKALLIDRLIQHDNDNNNDNDDNNIISIDNSINEIKKTPTILNDIVKNDEIEVSHNDSNQVDHHPLDKIKQEQQQQEQQKSNPFQWGKCSVGPILKQRLINAQLLHPTPIQEAAYPIINGKANNGKKSNVVLASPTGSGKTLAYILPLLSVTKRINRNKEMKKQSSSSSTKRTMTSNVSILIVTPTVELAYQIQKEVDKLWPREKVIMEKGGENSNNVEEEDLKELSALHVIDERSHSNNNNDNDNGMDTKLKLEFQKEFPLSKIYIDMMNSGAQILAGTPRSLQNLLSEDYQRMEWERKMERNTGQGQGQGEVVRRNPQQFNSNKHNNNNNYNNINNNKNNINGILSNLDTIVMDEADRLLQTESEARIRNEKKNNKKNQKLNSIEEDDNNNNNNNNMDGMNVKKQHKKKKNVSTFSTARTILLLRELQERHGISMDRGGISSSSSSLSSSSAASSSYYSRMNNNRNRRHVRLICASATVGRTLRHQIMNICDASSIDKAATLVGAGWGGSSTTSSNGVMIPNTLRHSYSLLMDSDSKDSSSSSSSKNDETSPTVASLVHRTMQHLEPGPAIIFPGKVGVERTVQDLRLKYGFLDVRTLGTLREKEGKGNVNSSFSSSNWENTCIYVVGEKFARGLDLSSHSDCISGDGDVDDVNSVSSDGSIRYAFLASPPSSPAAYVHLAGRTGRNGHKGTAITLVRGAKEARRVVSLSQALGVEFDAVENLGSN